MNVTVTDLDLVIADLEAFPVRLLANTRKAVQVTCAKVKDEARARISGHKYLPRYPYSITYSTTITLEGIEGEIGPDKSKAQGPLGNIIEFGTSKNAPIPHLGPALDANAEDLLTGIDIAIAQAIS